MFSLHRRRSDTSETIAVITLGSGAVFGSFVRLAPSKKPELLYSTRAPFPYYEEIDMDQYERSMLTALLDVGLSLQSEGREHLPESTAPTRVVCILAAPWYSSFSRRLSYTQQKSFAVSDDLVEKLIDEALVEFDDTMSSPENDTRLIEKHLIEASVNGYPTNKPFGKRGRSLSLALYASLAQDRIEQKSRDIITQVFNAEMPVDFHALDIVSFSVLRDLLGPDKSFLLLDVSAEVTEVALVQDGVLAGGASFPHGVHTIVRQHAKATGDTVESAEADIALLIRGEKASSAPVSITSLRDRWVQELEKTLKELAGAQSLPADVFILAQKPFGPWLSTGLSAPSLATLTLGHQPLSAKSALGTVLKGQCAIDASAKEEPFAMIGALFAARTLSSMFRETDAILTK